MTSPLTPSLCGPALLPLSCHMHTHLCRVCVNSLNPYHMSYLIQVHYTQHLTSPLQRRVSYLPLPHSGANGGSGRWNNWAPPARGRAKIPSGRPALFQEPPYNSAWLFQLKGLLIFPYSSLRERSTTKYECPTVTHVNELAVPRPLVPESKAHRVHSLPAMNPLAPHSAHYRYLKFQQRT